MKLTCEQEITIGQLRNLVLRIEEALSTGPKASEQTRHGSLVWGYQSERIWLRTDSEETQLLHEASEVVLIDAAADLPGLVQAVKLQAKLHKLPEAVKAAEDAARAAEVQ